MEDFLLFGKCRYTVYHLLVQVGLL